MTKFFSERFFSIDSDGLENLYAMPLALRIGSDDDHYAQHGKIASSVQCVDTGIAKAWEVIAILKKELNACCSG